MTPSLKKLIAILIIFTPIATIASGGIANKNKNHNHKKPNYEFTGDLTQGGLVIAELPKGVKAQFSSDIAKQFGNKLLIGFHRDEKKSHKLSLILPNGQTLIQKFDIKERKYKVQKINNLPKKMVTPPESVYKRIAEDNKAVKKARMEVIAECNLKEGWVVPSKGTITGVFGSKRVLNGKPKQPHYGIDIAAPKGTPVIAPRSGKVTLVHNDMYYTGKTMIVNHGCGLTSTFIHLDKIDVKEGDVVRKGQKIAEVGSTGRSTGPHLDWRVNLLDIRLDPQLLLE